MYTIVILELMQFPFIIHTLLSTSTLYKQDATQLLKGAFHA